MATIAATLWVCTDCIMLIANGEMPSEMTDSELADFTSRFGEGTMRELDDHAGTIAPGGESDCDDECAGECGATYAAFSPSPCDLCRSPLAGERSTATVIYD